MWGPVQSHTLHVPRDGPVPDVSCALHSDRGRKVIAYSRITSWAPDSSSEWKPVKKNTGATKLEFPSFQFAVEVQHRQLII
jgi:hypothetical protein